MLDAKQSKKRITQKDFKILLSFLNDKNEKTLILVKDQIENVVRRHPTYLKVVKSIKDPFIRRTAEGLIEEIRFQGLQPEIERLFSQGENLDLERAMFLLATIEYPELKPKDISTSLDKMAEDVDRLMGTLEPVPTRPVHAMRHYLFEKLGFKGNETNYYDPDNSYINKVLERKLGIPISLSALYLLVAWRLRMPVHGVGLPGHYIVGHRVPRGVIHIDPFNKGKTLRVKDCEVLVRRLGMAFKHEYLDPMPNLPTFSRMLVNLINVYNDQGNFSRAQKIAELFQRFES